MKRIKVYSTGSQAVLSSVPFDQALITIDELNAKISDTIKQYKTLYVGVNPSTIEHELIDE